MTTGAAFPRNALVVTGPPGEDNEHPPASSPTPTTAISVSFMKSRECHGALSEVALLPLVKLEGNATRHGGALPIVPDGPFPRPEIGTSAPPREQGYVRLSQMRRLAIPMRFDQI